MAEKEENKNNREEVKLEDELNQILGKYSSDKNLTTELKLLTQCP